MLAGGTLPMVRVPDPASYANPNWGLHPLGMADGSPAKGKGMSRLGG